VLFLYENTLASTSKIALVILQKFFTMASSLFTNQI